MGLQQWMIMGILSFVLNHTVHAQDYIQELEQCYQTTGKVMSSSERKRIIPLLSDTCMENTTTRIYTIDAGIINTTIFKLENFYFRGQKRDFWLMKRSLSGFNILFERKKSSKEMITLYLFDGELVFEGAIRGCGGYYSGGFIQRDGVYIQSVFNGVSFLNLTLEEFGEKVTRLINLIHTSQEGKIVTPQIEIKFPTSCQG